ncbi:MAG: hypothetical protein ACLVHL_01255 [Collinsella intestinalis]
MKVLLRGAEATMGSSAAGAFGALALTGLTSASAARRRPLGIGLIGLSVGGRLILGNAGCSGYAGAPKTFSMV